MKYMFNRVVLEKIQNGVCPYCGRGGFKFTISHIVQKHRIQSDEVRLEFGINPHEPLCTPELSEIYSTRAQCHSEKTLEALRNYRENQSHTRSGFAPQSRENHLSWLLSDRHLEIAKRAFASEKSQENLRKWANEAWKKRVRNPDGTFAGATQ